MGDSTSLKCGFCHRGSSVDKICGKLHSQFTKEQTWIVAHQKCMQYSAKLCQYKFDHFGGFKISKVQEEMNRAKYLKCFICKKTRNCKIPLGMASAGCAVKKCRRSFHYYCAKTDHNTITKRLIVSFKNKNKKTVLYRVFCSAEHEEQYRTNLKQLLDVGKTSKIDVSKDFMQEETSDLDEGDDSEEDDVSNHLLDNSLVSFETDTSLAIQSDCDSSPSTRQSYRMKSTLATSSTRGNGAGDWQNADDDVETTEPENMETEISSASNSLWTAEKSPTKSSAASVRKLSSESPASPAKLSGKSSGTLSRQSHFKTPEASPSAKANLNPRVSLESIASVLKRNPKQESDSEILRKRARMLSSKNHCDVKSMPESSSKKEKKQPATSVDSRNQNEENKSYSFKKSTETNNETEEADFVDVVNTGDADGDDDFKMISCDEEISKNNKKREMETDRDTFQQKRDFVLCVPAVSVVTEALRLQISREVTEMRGHKANILIWHDLHPETSFTDKEIVFLIADLAKCTENNDNFGEFCKFLKNSSYLEKKINSEYMIRSKMLTELGEPTIINQILEKTWQNTSELLGSADSILSLENCKVLMITVTDAHDPDGHLRSLWPASSLHLWNNSTKLSVEKCSSHALEEEETMLENWFDDNVLPVGKVAIYPQESILKTSESSTEMVELLKQKMEDSCDDDLATNVLIFENVDKQVVNFDNYVKKIVSSVDSSDLVVFLPASHLKSRAERAVVISLLPGNLQPHAKVFTAFDPSVKPSAWVVLHISA